MKWTAPVLLAIAISVSQITATDVRAAELPKSTEAMLKELKLDKSILKGLDEELKVPAGWIEKARKEKDLIIISSWDQLQFIKMTDAFWLQRQRHLPRPSLRARPSGVTGPRSRPEAVQQPEPPVQRLVMARRIGPPQHMCRVQLPVVTHDADPHQPCL